MEDSREERREEAKNDASSVQDQPKPITDEEMRKLKEKDKKCYGKHEILTVKDDKVELKEVPVDSFAVQLKIVPQPSPKTEYKDEMRTHLENLSHSTHHQIDISQLIEEESRVTFIRGTAGMGKSVLAKQLILQWAKGEIYQEFKCCIMIECRDINYIRSTKGENWKKHEIFDKVLKEQFNYDLGDGKEVLIILDGLDELYDIQEDDSIIGQLLHVGRSKYEMSKIIVTGSPDIENKLSHEMGGLRIVEIQGLGKEQIDKYIDNFSSVQGNISYIRDSRDSSTFPLAILHIPQFLNTFCCVAILRKGKEIENVAELYLWTLYLLLRQHVSESRDEERFPICFERYSELLQFISKICHELLNENKVIIERRIKGMIKEMIPDIEKEKENFIHRLLVDVSNDGKEMYQFKYLSLMEFLAALHICSNISNWMDTIKEYLKKGYIEVASHFCRLIAGISSSRIITALLEKVSKLTDFDKKLFLKSIITILNESEIVEETKFKRSIDFIAYFTTKDFKCKDEILSIISKLHYAAQFLSDTSDMILVRSISHICNHLTKECGCTDDEIRKAFENFLIEEFDVQDKEHLEIVKYLNVSWIILRKTGVSAVRSILKDGMLGNCKSLSIVQCNLVDDQEGESDLQGQTSVRMLDGLGISRCTLTKESFNDVCELGLVSKKFFLRALEIESDWWMILIGKIIEQKANGSLQLKELYIESCSTTLTEDMVSMIAQCHVLVKSNHQSTDTRPDSPKSLDDENSSPVQDTQAPLLQSYDDERSCSDLAKPYDEESELEVAGDDIDDSIKKNQIVIDSKGGFFRCDALNLSLTVPENSVDHEVQLKISSTNTSNVPPISCDFGEVILSDAILLEPIGMEFRKPAVLSIDHSVVELPELTSIVIKCYDHENKEWITLPTGTDGANQELQAASGEISRASIFAVCLSLDLDTYTVTKDGSSFAPFGSQYRVKVAFEENTFGDKNAILEFKMNVFSETAVGELSRFGLKPFPILHVKEKNKKQPLKPITIKLPINGQIQSDEKVVVICADSDGITALREITSYHVAKHFLTFQLDHFTIVSAIIQIGKRVGEYFDFRKVFQLLRPYASTRHLVEFITYRDLSPSPRETFYIGCCVQGKADDLHKLMDQLHCVAIHASQEELFSNTDMVIKLDGPHTNNGPLNLKFINNNCNHTDDFRITVNERHPQDIKFMIYKVGDDYPFKRINCEMIDKDDFRQFVNENRRARREDARIFNIHNSNVQFGAGNVQRIGVNPFQ